MICRSWNRKDLFSVSSIRMELAWKVMQDFLKYKGYDFALGPNGAPQKAFEDGLITNHDAWRRMNKARGTTSHTYNEGDALKL